MVETNDISNGSTVIYKKKWNSQWRVSLGILALAIAAVAVVGCSKGTAPDAWRFMGADRAPDVGQPMDTAPRKVDTSTRDTGVFEPDTEPDVEPVRESRLTSGSFTNCFIDRQGAHTCWGKFAGKRYTGVPEGRFQQFALGHNHHCGLTTGGKIKCWGIDDYEFGKLAPPQSSGFSEVKSGMHHSCALDEQGDVSCWGAGDEDGTGEWENVLQYDQSMSPSGQFDQLFIGSFHNCAVATDGEVTCWGEDVPGLSEALTEIDFREVASANGFSCALLENSTVRCWGEAVSQPPGQQKEDEPFPSPEGQFEQIEAYAASACGIRPDGEVSCWEHPPKDISTNEPGGTFVDVSVGSVHACGLRPDQTVECWGQDFLGSTRVPRDLR